MSNTIRGNMKSRGLHALVAASAIVAVLGLGMATAHATTISASVGGVPTGADCYETFNSLSTGSGGGTTTDCGITVSFTPDAQAVTGGAPSVYAPPVLSLNNGALFGGMPDGEDTTVYLAAGSTTAHPGAGVTLDFTGKELRYFGLLWGSVDSYNTLTFFQNGIQVAQFTGNNVSEVAGTGNCVNGNQTSIGTCYVNINLSDWFNSVVATSSEYTFEFDNVAFAKNPIGVPEPGEIGMFLFGLLLAGTGVWYRKREMI